MAKKKVKIPLAVGMEFYIVNCKQLKVYKDKIISLAQIPVQRFHPNPTDFYTAVKLKKFKHSLSEDFFQSCINPKVIQQSNLYIICESIRFKGTQTDYYVFTTELQAQNHLTNHVLPVHLNNLKYNAERTRKEYMNFVDETGKIEKQIEQEKQKLKSLKKV
jgi:hypothetical protein